MNRITESAPVLLAEQMTTIETTPVPEAMQAEINEALAVVDLAEQEGKLQVPETLMRGTATRKQPPGLDAGNKLYTN